MLKLKDKERTQIINALKTGVVPVIGLRHVQVGRIQEVRNRKRLRSYRSRRGYGPFCCRRIWFGEKFFPYPNQTHGSRKKIAGYEC